MTTEISSDFFIYVPTMHDVKTLTSMNVAGQKERSFPEGKVRIGFDDEDWIRIPLEGKFVVYAHLWEKPDD